MDAYDQMAERGRQLAESLRTPSERMAAELDELRDLFDHGAIDAATYERALAKTRDSIEQPIVTKYEVDGVAAAVAGSQEAAAAIARHRRMTANDTYAVAAPPKLNAATAAAADTVRSSVDATDTRQAAESSRQAALLQRIADTLAAIDRNTAEPSLQVQEVSL